jgi:AcrR family transcriptional regulator
MQKIGAELGLSDAAIHYHFGSRKKLLEALMRHAGRKLRAALDRSAPPVDANTELSNLIERLDDTYRRKGYARLALWLAITGSEPRRGAMFRETALAIHKGRAAKSAVDETLFAVALLNIFLIGEALAGDVMLSGVGLEDDEATRERLRQFAYGMVTERLGLKSLPKRRTRR